MKHVSITMKEVLKSIVREALRNKGFYNLEVEDVSEDFIILKNDNETFTVPVDDILEPDEN